MSQHYNPRKPYCDHYTIEALLAMARGQWAEILADAGIPPDALVGRRGRPCPRCGGRDRFAPMADLAERGAVLCRSCFHAATDPRPGDGLATLRWWLSVNVVDALRWLKGSLGVGPNDPAPVQRMVERRLSIPKPSIAPERWADLVGDCSGAMRPGWLCRAADLLGLDPEPLARLGVGWSAEHRATSWPMRDDAGRVIGVRLRCPKTSRKWAVRGSRAGLFFDVALLSAERPRRLWVPEGPTDTAALLSIGLDAVGVPSAGGGADLLIDLARAIRPAEIVVVADADGPGRDGAERVGESLLIVAPVRIIAPDRMKDARAWVAAGGRREAFEAAADAAPVRRLAVRGCYHG